MNMDIFSGTEPYCIKREDAFLSRPVRLLYMLHSHNIFKPMQYHLIAIDHRSNIHCLTGFSLEHIIREYNKVAKQRIIRPYGSSCVSFLERCIFIKRKCAPDLSIVWYTSTYFELVYLFIYCFFFYHGNT